MNKRAMSASLCSLVRLFVCSDIDYAMTKRLTTIRASEVGEYLYCTRAWWLRRVAGLEPEGQERRERGTLLHIRHGRDVAASGALIWVGCVVLLLAILMLLVR
jgi:hypothetical protein